MEPLTQQKMLDAIKPALEALSRPEFAHRKERYFKHEIHALGITLPELRALAKLVVEQPRDQLEDTVIATCASLLQSKYHEERLMGLIVLSRCKPVLSDAVFVHAEDWLLTQVCDWALVDELCGGTLYHVMLKFPECISFLQRWNKAENMWLRRASVVVLVKFARKGLYVDESYELADNLASATEDLIHKASGWLLREAGKTDPERLRMYLLTRGKQMSRTSVRYAIEHFEERERKELLELTRN